MKAAPALILTRAAGDRDLSSESLAKAEAVEEAAAAHDEVISQRAIS